MCELRNRQSWLDNKRTVLGRLPIPKQQSLPTVSEEWGKVMFSVCSHRGEGVPKGTYPPGQVMIGEGYTKVPTPWPRYLPLARSGQGEGLPQGTYPLARWGSGYPKVPPPSQGTYPTGQNGEGEGEGEGKGTPRYLSSQPRYLPPPDRTAYGLPHTLRSVCLLRSRRKTFLLMKSILIFTFAILCIIQKTIEMDNLDDDNISFNIQNGT